MRCSALTVCQNSARLLRGGNPAYAPRTGIHYRHSRYDRRGARATSCGTTQCRATKSHWFYPHNDSSRLGDIRQVQVNLRKGAYQNPTWPDCVAIDDVALFAADSAVNRSRSRHAPSVLPERDSPNCGKGTNQRSPNGDKNRVLRIAFRGRVIGPP